MAKTLCDCEFTAHWLLLGLGKLALSVGEKDKLAISRDMDSAFELVRDLEGCLKKSLSRTRMSLLHAGRAAKADEWDKAGSEAMYALMEVLRDTCE